jgi:PST family polysaccharide transporter
LIGATIFSRITDQGDKFILAKFLGLDKLGVYNIAFQLAELVTSQSVQVSNNVLSSVLPKYVGDKERFYKHYSAFLKTFSFFIFPLLAMMFIAAKPIILFLYGNKWIEAVLPMQILIVVAAFKAVSSSYGSVMNSFHLNRKSFVVTAVYAPFHLIASAVGSMFGVAGLAAGVAIVKVIFINWNIKQIMGAVSLRFIKWYADVSPFFVVNILLGALMSFFYSVVLIKLLPALSIVIVGVLFIVAYVLVFRLAYNRQIKDISAFINATFPKLSPYFNFVFNI